MCVGGMSPFSFSSWESVCIGVLWTSMRPKRESESKQVGIPLMSKDVAHMNSVPFLMMTFKVFLKTLYFHNHTSVSCQIRETYFPIP